MVANEITSLSSGIMESDVWTNTTFCKTCNQNTLVSSSLSPFMRLMRVIQSSIQTDNVLCAQCLFVPDGCTMMAGALLMPLDLGCVVSFTVGDYYLSSAMCGFVRWCAYRKCRPFRLTVPL